MVQSEEKERTHKFDWKVLFGVQESLAEFYQRLEIGRVVHECLLPSFCLLSSSSEVFNLEDVGEREPSPR